MLVPAIVYKDELLRAFARELYTEKYFYFWGGSPTMLPNLEPDNNKYQFAIINPYDKSLIGFLCYCVYSDIDSVEQFGLYSFDEECSAVIGNDLATKLEELIEQHHKVEWHMISGNPVQRHYDYFLKRHGGTLSVRHDVCKDDSGNYHNEYIYEVIKGGKK
jgi:hypothetical protein